MTIPRAHHSSAGEGDGHKHGHEHAHEHLRHLPADAGPAVFAGSADVTFAGPRQVAHITTMVTDFVAALSTGLAAAGCVLVGHIKGVVGGRHGDLAFHLTVLGAEPEQTVSLAGPLEEAVLTLNVIVFGVDDEALPDLVKHAWSHATGASTAWKT